MEQPKQMMIDGFEGELARCTTPEGAQLVLPRATLPQEAKEQDWLRLVEGEYQLDTETTQQKKEANAQLYAKLKAKPSKLED